MNNFKMFFIYSIIVSSSWFDGCGKRVNSIPKYSGLWINWPNQSQPPPPGAVLLLCVRAYIWILVCICNELSGIAVGWLMALVRWNRKSFLLIFIFLWIWVRFLCVVVYSKDGVVDEWWNENEPIFIYGARDFHSFQQRFVDNVFHLIY